MEGGPANKDLVRKKNHSGCILESKHICCSSKIRKLQVSPSYHRHTDTSLLGGSKYLPYLLAKSCRSLGECICILGELVLTLRFHLRAKIRPAGQE